MIADPLFLACITLGPLVYWLLPARVRNGFLVLLSVGYLSSIALWPTLAIVGWTTLFFWLAPKAKSASRPRVVTGTLLLAILGWMALFKYVPRLVDAIATTSLEAQLLVPIGISYYAFKLVHYAIEVGRGRIPEHRLSDALVWATLFPAFSAGPIERFDHFLAQRHERPDAELVAAGMTRILHGLVKKVFFADLILLSLAGSPTELVNHLDTTSTLSVWGFCFVMYLWAYLDFSAYSDIAIGASKLFGIELMENFDWPILAGNLSQFWKRWHMTLAGWCQAYVYLPSVGLTRNPYLATYATFLVMGLWHGAALNWLFWGLFHGTGVATNLTWNRYKRRRKWHKWMDKGAYAWVGVLPTTLFVTAAASFTTTVELGGWAGLRVFAKLFFIG